MEDGLIIYNNDGSLEGLTLELEDGRKYGTLIGTNDVLLGVKALGINDGPELSVTEYNTDGVEDGTVFFDNILDGDTLGNSGQRPQVTLQVWKPPSVLQSSSVRSTHEVRLLASFDSSNFNDEPTQ